MKAVTLLLLFTILLVYMSCLAKCGEKPDDIFDFNLMDFDLSSSHENNKTRNITKPTTKPVSDNIEIMEMSDDSGSARNIQDIGDESSDDQRNKSSSLLEMSWLDTLRLMSQKCPDNDTRVVHHIAQAELIAEEMSKLEEALAESKNKSLVDENKSTQQPLIINNTNGNNQKSNSSSVRPSQQTQPQLSNG